MLTKIYNDNKQDIKIAGISAVLTSLISYYFFMISGYSLPDGIVEGLYYYDNPTHHLVDGRWAVRYLNLVFGHNVVMPHVVVIFYALCMAAAAILVSKLFNTNNKLFLAATASVLSVSNVVTEQLTFPHVALTFSFAFLFAVLFVYLVDKKKILPSIVGIIALSICMGLYQAYIGAAVALILLVTIIRLLNEEKIKNILVGFLWFASCGILGCLLDVAEYSIEIKLRDLYKAQLVDSFGIGEILSKLNKTLGETYSVFYEYFADPMLKRRYLYAALFVIALAALLILIYELIKKKLYLNALLVIAFLLLIPLTMNIIRVLIPYYPIHILMKYHLVLMIPFCFAIILKAFSGIKYRTIIETVAWVLLTAIISTYVISANATFLALRVSYKALETNTSMILNDVYDVEGYVPGETVIIFAGFPKEGNIREKLGIYNYAILEATNAAFWENYNGITNCRRNYLLYYFGLESGTFTEDEYRAITGSDEFINMPVWPAEGSVEMINGIVVAKLTDEPPVI